MQFVSHALLLLTAATLPVLSQDQPDAPPVFVPSPASRTYIPRDETIILRPHRGSRYLPEH